MAQEYEIDKDGIGEICQFLSTLLVLQDVSEVSEEDKGLLVPKLARWKRSGKGALAGNASERCLDLLTNKM
jgi:hypothetical protein